MRVVPFEAEDWEKTACATLMRQQEDRCTTAPLNVTTVEDFRDAEMISPFVTSRVEAAVIDRLPPSSL